MVYKTLTKAMPAYLNELINSRENLPWWAAEFGKNCCRKPWFFVIRRHGLQNSVPTGKVHGRRVGETSATKVSGQSECMLQG